MRREEGKLRVAIVGAGYVAKHHLGALARLDFVEIVAICDVDPEAARRLAQQFGVRCVGSALADCAHTRPHAIWVLTPPSSHASIALEALEMGCHVFVEKPMAQTRTECAAMIDKAREKGLMLSVNHSDRLDPIVLAALEKVRGGACGDVVCVDFIRSSDYAPYGGGPRRGPYRQGSYPFQDIGVHGLYLLESFLGRIVKLEVSYRSVLDDPYLLFDDWVGVAHGERGIGRLHLSWAVRPMQNRLIVQGTRGVLEVDRFLQTMTLSRNLPGPKFVGMVLSAVLGSLRRAVSVCRSVVRFALGRLPPSPGIRAGAVDFAKAIVEQRPPLVPAEEGLRMVELMESVSSRADAEAERTFAERLKPLEPVDALVTGAAGFVGRALVRRLLDEGRKVRALVRRSRSGLQESSSLQIVVGDLGDPEIVEHAVAGARIVYHVGATMRGAAEQFRAGTIIGTDNVIESCLRQRCERLVYVSSLSVMDHAGRREDTILREDSPYEPHPERRGLYTQTKLDAERAILRAMRERNLPAVVIRPGQIFGADAAHVPPNGVIALGTRWILVGDGKAPLPLVHIDDVVDGLVAAGRAEGAVGRVFNLVDTASVSQNDYLDALRGSGPGAPRIVRMPWPVMLLLGRVADVAGRLLGRELPISHYRVCSLRPLANFDCTAAHSGLGWQPRVGARQGLARLLGAMS